MICTQYPSGDSNALPLRCKRSAVPTRLSATRAMYYFRWRNWVTIPACKGANLASGPSGIPVGIASAGNDSGRSGACAYALGFRCDVAEVIHNSRLAKLVTLVKCLSPWPGWPKPAPGECPCVGVLSSGVVGGLLSCLNIHLCSLPSSLRPKRQAQICDRIPPQQNPRFRGLVVQTAFASHRRWAQQLAR